MTASYKILSVKQAEDTIYTEIEYTNAVDEVLTTVVAHFQPQSREDVEQTIANRFASEDQKLQADKRCAQIVQEIALGIKTDFDAIAEVMSP